MNFLAHLYLSGNDDLIKIGNFMADGIHGKKLDHFPPNIKKGIILHRAIDSFTDTHVLFRQSTKRLHPHYHHYSGIIVDIFYDHFLAKNWENYSTEKLQDYTERFYTSLQLHYAILTPKTQQMLPSLLRQNWLNSYQTIEGIALVLEKMDRRINRNSNMRQAVVELEKYYDEFEDEFKRFFIEIQIYTANTIQNIV